MDARSICFLAAPIVFAAALLWQRRCKRLPGVASLVFYVLLLAILLGGAMFGVASVAGARVAPFEVAVVVWFAATARLAWELWSATVGRLGDRFLRLGRVRRRRGGSIPIAWRLIRPARIAATAFIFAPLFLSIVLTHRFKMLDGTDPKTTLGMAYEHAQIAGRDGIELDAWFVPSTGAKRTIVICHGAGANKGNFIWFLPPLAHRGYNLVLFDFRAHGGSGGRVCTYGICEKDDVLAVVDWLKREHPAQAERIVGLGSSLGSFALARAAAEDERIDAVVLDSPFTSPREFAHFHLGGAGPIGRAFADGVLWLMSRISGGDFLHTGTLASVAAMKRRPLLVIHGADDVLMPAAHSQAIFDAVAEPKRLWLGPGPHSNIITAEPDEYSERLFAFLRETLP